MADAPQIVPLVAQDTDFAIVSRPTIDGVQLVVSVRWLPRLAEWTADWFDPDGNAIALGCRISPQARVNAVTGPLMPPGFLAWVGPDPYDRMDLGPQVQLAYWPVGSVLPEWAL